MCRHYTHLWGLRCDTNGFDVLRLVGRIPKKKGKQVITTKSITNDYLMPSHGCSFGYSLDGVVKNNSILSIPDIKTEGGLALLRPFKNTSKIFCTSFGFFLHSDCLQHQPEEELEL